MSNYTLFKHQEEGIAFLKEKKKAIIAYDMGLGKTLIAILASQAERKDCTLVICPASLKINWQREILKWVDEESFIIASGEVQEIPEDTKWIIINYDILGKHLERLKGMYDTVIVDEAHYIKDESTIRSKAVLEVVSNAERVYLLTGTPMLNRPIELYPLLQAVEHPLGKKGMKTAYAVRYCGAVKKNVVMDLHTGRRSFVTNPYPYYRNKRYKVYTFMDMKGATNLVELRESISKVMQRRLKKDAIDLPEKIKTTVQCQLTNEDMQRYEQAFDDYIEWLSNHPQEDKNIENILMTKHLVEIQKLKQVCSEAKIPKVVEMVQSALEQGEKVIIFSQYTKTIQTLHSLLGGVTLTGDDTQEERQQAVDSFQNDPETKVFIGNIKAGGVGITLTSASIVMFADMEWSPGVHDQAEDRAHRIGQNGTVNVYYFVAEATIEEDIMDMLDAKRKVIEEVIDGKKEAIAIKGMQQQLMDMMRKKFSTS
jgi:SWI/SNF-related matrix-associated actin-dependent regulator 1 of chromatin subfamily A